MELLHSCRQLRHFHGGLLIADMVLVIVLIKCRSLEWWVLSFVRRSSSWDLVSKETPILCKCHFNRARALCRRWVRLVEELAVMKCRQRCQITKGPPKSKWDRDHSDQNQNPEEKEKCQWHTQQRGQRGPKGSQSRTPARSRSVSTNPRVKVSGHQQRRSHQLIQCTTRETRGYCKPLSSTGKLKKGGAWPETLFSNKPY